MAAWFCKICSIFVLRFSEFLNYLTRMGWLTHSRWSNKPQSKTIKFVLHNLTRQSEVRPTYVTVHSPTLPLLHLRHSSYSNPSFASPTSQPLHLMSRAHSPTIPSLHLRQNSFSNPSVALPTSQLILQPFRCFTYVTVHSPTLLLLLLCHKLFT